MGWLFGDNQHHIKIGDRVYIPWTGQTGYVVSINGDLCQVSITKEDGTDMIKTFSLKDVKLAKGII